VLTVASPVRVYLATEPVDLRRGHDGLCALVRARFQLDPYTGHLFAFVGRRGDRIKVLYWDRGGFVLLYKRLEAGRFRLPPIPAGATTVTLDAASLVMLLGGVDLRSVRRVPAWEPARASA
jgi:transposase